MVSSRRTYCEYIDYIKKEKGQQFFDDNLMHGTISGCYNIHKSLVPAIKAKLNELGINKNYIYPNMDDFRHSVTNQGILDSLTLKK